MAENLTEEQRQAVTNRGGRLLVSAAAGSGKTKVLVDRLMGYIMDPADPANIDDFLIITYTKAAAAELRVKIGNKLSSLIADNPTDKHLQRQLQRLYLTKISTVHSFCSEVLRQYAYRLDIPADFRQAEDNECTQMQALVLERVLNESYDNIMQDEEFRQFVDSQGFGRSDKSLNKLILQIYHQSVNFPDPGQWLDDCAAYMDVQNLTDVSQTKWGRYLIERLYDHLDRTLPFMERAVQIAQQSAGGANVAVGLADSLAQLHFLRRSETWDQILDRKNITYCDLRYKKGTTDDEKLMIRCLRDACKVGTDKICADIVDRSAVILSELHRSAPAVRGMCKTVKRFAAAYAEEKRRRHLMDYTDLEQMCLDLLCGKSRNTVTAIAKEVGSAYREIMVDEYQDSNAVQDAIFTALTEEKKNCFMVGDVKQSIYQFRQADPGIFLGKYSTYVDAAYAEAGQGRRVLLSHNFRSGDEILQAANAVFETSMRPELGGLLYDDSVSLKEGISHEPLGEPAVELYAVQTTQSGKDDQEAAFVAQRISELLDGTHCVRCKEGGLRPIVPEDIVILLRSPSSQESHFVKALSAKGIRCVSSRDVPLLETQENMLLISLLQVIHNPQLDIPLAAVLCSCVFGFTADDLASIRGQYAHCSLYDSLCRSDHQKAREFVKTLSDLRAKARMSGVCRIIEEIFARTHMAAVFSAMPDGAQRLDNLEALYQHAAEFESWGRCDLARFIEHLEIMDASRLTASQSKQNTGCVSITSIHKSKGLEYPVVFLCGLSRSFSSMDLTQQILSHKELGYGISATDDARRILYPTISKKAIKHQMIHERNSEEMRVLYVAMTRPMDRLIMTYAGMKLEDKIRNCVIAQNVDAQNLIAQQAGCMGDWVLLSAVKRLEAGELFSIGGQCCKASITQHPWLIRVVTPPSVEDTPLNEEKQTVSPAAIDKIRDLQGFTYSHSGATVMPSKLTATQLNREQSGRIVHFWRKPGIKQSGGSAYGNIMHSIMEHLDFAHCTDAQTIGMQLDDFAQKGLISADDRAEANVSELTALFMSDIGKKLRTHPNVLREFQFSILDEPDDPGLAGEKVLLQGVVDCAMVDDDGIVIIDFKTDHVSEENVTEKLKLYKPQISTYAKAMSRIYAKPVKAAYLYFFRLGRAIPII